MTVKKLPLGFAFGFVISAAIAVNVLLLREAFFIWQVLVPLGAAFLCGVGWLTIKFTAEFGAFDRDRDLRRMNVVAASVVVLGICIALYAFAGRIDQSWDLSLEGRQQLSEQTIQILEGLDRNVEVLCLFLNIGDREIDISRDKTRRFLERCQEHTPYLDFSFVDPQKEKGWLADMGMTSAALQGTVVIQCGTRKRSVSLTGEPARLAERDFTNTLLNVTRAAAPQVDFLTGHGERTGTDVALLKALLEGEAYRVRDLAMLPAEPKVPDDCDVLVINTLQSELKPAEIDAVQRFLDDGGRLLLLLDPVRMREGEPMTRMTFLSWLESRYGIIVGDDLVVTTRGQDFRRIDLLPDSAAINLFQKEDVMNVDFHGCFASGHPITRGFGQTMTFDSARSVTLAPDLPEGVVASTILRSLPLRHTWAEKRLHLLRPGVGPKLDPDELTGSIGLAVAAVAKTNVPVGDTGVNRDSRIVVVGDSDIVAGESVLVSGHLNFFMNVMAWLSENEELIAIRPTGLENRPILLAERDERAIVWIATLGVAQAVLLVGLVVFLFRRKYQ